MATSFLSEHSVEYCLVYQLNLLLRTKWNVIPLFFWNSREGSRIARTSNHAEDIETRIIAVYARRPKLSLPGDDKIIMKVNGHVLSRAKYLINQGIPVFCGVPLVTSLLDYNMDSQCCWFLLAPKSDCIDEEIILDVKTRKARNNTNEGPVIPIDKHQIVSIIEKSAGLMKLRDAIESIKWRREVELGNPSFHHFLYGGYYYKPFYLILRESRTRLNPK